MNTGIPVRVGWTTPGSRDPFLVLDRNNNGAIDSGAELFGNFSPQPRPGRRESKNGFLALGVFDKTAEGGNGDGRITSADRIYSSLKLWFDSNHDGISQASELFGLADYGVTSISLDYKVGKKTDEFGNLYRYRSPIAVTQTTADPRRAAARRLAFDVYLTYIK
jgi:hypothetical protein